MKHGWYDSEGGTRKIRGGKLVGYEFIHHKSKIGLILKPGVRGKRPANNRPNICAALKNFFFSKKESLRNPRNSLFIPANFPLKNYCFYAYLKTRCSSAGSVRNTRDFNAITDLPPQIPCAMRLFPY